MEKYEAPGNTPIAEATPMNNTKHPPLNVLFFLWLFLSPAVSWRFWLPRRRRTLSWRGDTAPPPVGPAGWWWTCLEDEEGRDSFVYLWIMTLCVLAEALQSHQEKTNCSQRLTHHIIVLKAQLAGLAGLEDLHPDEFNLRPAIQKHLLGSC